MIPPQSQRSTTGRRLSILRATTPASLTAALLLLLAPTALAAAQTGGVREVSASARNVIPLDTRVRYTTMVVLPESEEILDVICGDRDYWVISAAQNIAHIKPAKEGAATNLNLVTNTGAIYSFVLTERANTPPDLKVYVITESGGPASKPRFYPAAQVAALESQINDAYASAEAFRRAADESIATFKAQYPTSLRFVFRAPIYQAPFLVRAIWHDGAFTYFKSDATELPALYEVVDDEPSLVNFQVHNGIYVVPKVIENGYLALGKKHFVFFKDR